MKTPTLLLILSFALNSGFGWCVEAPETVPMSIEIIYNSGHFGPARYTISPEKIYWFSGGQYSNSKTAKINQAIFSKLVRNLKDGISPDVTQQGENIPGYSVTIVNADGSKQQKNIPFGLTIESNNRPAPFLAFARFIREVETLCRYLSDN